jgi:hypothetical protein
MILDTCTESELSDEGERIIRIGLEILICVCYHLYISCHF